MSPSAVEHDSPPAYTFKQLVEHLSAILGPKSGINSEDVDPEELQSIMRRYISDETQWSYYAYDDASRAYTRNLIDRGNGKSNLLILVWTAGRESAIHDHADSHCLMKVLKGSLKETRYKWPKKSDCPLSVERETVFGENEVTYMSDQLGLHKISNMNPDEVAVSLHLYTPPNAAKFGCNLYNAQTGKATHVHQAGYFSELGVKTGGSC